MIKRFTVIIIFLTSNMSFAGVEDMGKEDLCMHLATYYAKGSHSHWMLAIKEVRKRGYGLECKEIAELRMAATRYAALPSFKLKLDEMFGATPKLFSDEHFLNKKKK